MVHWLFGFLGGRACFATTHLLVVVVCCCCAVAVAVAVAVVLLPLLLISGFWQISGGKELSESLQSGSLEVLLWL